MRKERRHNTNLPSEIQTQKYFIEVRTKRKTEIQPAGTRARVPAGFDSLVNFYHWNYFGVGSLPRMFLELEINIFRCCCS